ncbi:putative transcriptional regulator protein [Paraburkholderia caribensis MBA4]|uniref:Putative transcriptional regulator protein n=1 Tax=Paraburkholderia caribensis MBA4 TaxID=1323664 RepID=A0A0P0RKP4_9BURK|nr:putative transcriptional regulator protein [Paraburkholderia caribensis MBA4]
MQDFIDIAQRLFDSGSLPAPVRELSGQVFERLDSEIDDGRKAGTRYPACTYLDLALAPLLPTDSLLGAAARGIKTLEPFIGWQRRTSGLNGSEQYVERHVNGIIVGPGGTESRYDVQLGFSLLAPDTRYPDHRHAPQEAYVLFTPGEFRQADGDWFDPGIGGGLYNVSNILHAMRSHDQPLLAMWCLLT